MLIRTLPICACLLVALASARSVLLMEIPFGLMNGANPGAVAENLIGRYTSVISLLSASLLLSAAWAVRLAQKASYLSSLLALVAAGSMVFPISLQWEALQKTRDLMASPGVDVLDLEIVYILYFGPAKAAVWFGLGAITLISASGLFFSNSRSSRPV